MNPYQVLQLPQDASYDQIKQRYRHLSKMVHPDKHSIQNYQIAQSCFKQIDQAYKSISSSLRRYIYKHYGSVGIHLVQNNPFTFSQFQKADLDDPTVLDRLNQLIVYCLYQQYASNQIDKTTLRTKSMMLVNKPINQVNLLPSIQRSQFSFETSLPDFWGMSHTASITHSSEGLNSQTKSQMFYGIGSSKRINETLMLNAHTNFSSQRVSIEAGIDKVVNNNLIIHFIPIHFQNGNMHGPQIGADFHRDNYYVSGVTNLKDFTVQIGSSPSQKNVVKSVKFGFDGDSFVISPVYQRDLTSRLRIFTQLQLKAEQSGPNATTFGFGIAYGYRLKLLDQLKLQLASYIGLPHTNFQISIITPKFKASIPIFSKADVLTFELYKLGAFIGIYLSFQLYNYYVKKTDRRKRRIEHENYNRLSVQKIAVTKNNSDNSIAAADSKEIQEKYQGLIILGAYIGSLKSLKKIQSQVSKIFDLNRKNYIARQAIQIYQRFDRQIKTNDDNYKEQLYNITQTLQARVKGAQLFNFDLEELRVNPCIDEKQTYFFLSVCFIRGKIVTKIQEKNKNIRIGKLSSRYEMPLIEKLWNYIKIKVVN